MLVILLLYQVTTAINLWGQWGKFKKMYPISLPFTVIECIRTSKNYTSFTSPSLLCWNRKKGLSVLFAFFILFPWFNTVGEIRPWNIPLAQLPKITVINVATQLKLRFRVMLALRNHTLKMDYFGFSEKGQGNFSPPHFVHDFSGKIFLLSLSDCLYFMRYWAACVLRLLVNQVVTS